MTKGTCFVLDSAVEEKMEGRGWVIQLSRYGKKALTVLESQ